MLKKWLFVLCCVGVLIGMTACQSEQEAVVESEKSTSPPVTETTTSAETTQTNPVDKMQEETVMPGSTPLFYKATDADGDVIWLLGSIHVATEDMYPLPQTVLNAYEQADALAVECDIVAYESDYAAITAMASSWMYAGTDTITNHISEELYAKAKDILKENQMYMVLVDKYIPSIWSSLVDSATVAKLGYDVELGIDRYFIERAYDENKLILEIESVEFQNDMLVGFSEELQTILLESSVDTYNDPDTVTAYQELFEAWCMGDEDRLTQVIAAEEEEFESEEERQLYEEYNNALIIERNITMTDYAEECLKNGDEVFICVGAAHVVGEDAMVDLLRERGYTVETVQ